MIHDAIATATRLTIAGSATRDAEPECRRQRIYIANHTSHLDFVVLWSNLPAAVRRRTFAVAARDYWEKGAIRRFLATRVFHALLIDRRPVPGDVPGCHGRRVVSAMVKAMGISSSLILFPEGTRGSGDEIAPFKSGLYHLCLARPDAEVVPVYLHNLGRILPKGRWLPMPLRGRVTYGVPIQLRHGELKNTFLARARAAVQELADR